MRAAASEANICTAPRYDSQNPQALKRLVANGTQLRPCSEPILDGCFRSAYEVYADISGRNADFRTMWESMKAFRGDQYLWMQVAENTYDTYMMIQQRKKTL